MMPDFQELGQKLYDAGYGPATLELPERIQLLVNENERLRAEVKNLYSQERIKVVDKDFISALDGILNRAGIQKINEEDLITDRVRRLRDERNNFLTISLTSKKEEIPAGWNMDSPPKEPEPEVTRAAILDAAKRYVTKDRASTHGKAEDSFQNMADGWEWYLRMRKPGPLNSVDVAEMMVIFKLVRSTMNPEHVDNWIDKAGYSACGGEIAANRYKF